MLTKTHETENTKAELPTNRNSQNESVNTLKKIKNHIGDMLSSDEEKERKETTRKSHREGCEKIKNFNHRRCHNILGRITSIVIPPACEQKTNQTTRNIPEGFTVLMSDGEDNLKLIFIGRKNIKGLTPGTLLKVEGFVTETVDYDGGMFSSVKTKTIYNPRYTIVPHQHT